MNKNILKNICIIMFLFFSFIGNVNANFFDSSNGQNDIFTNCVSSKNCIPLCVYSNDNGDEVGLIGYYYDTKNWEIAFRGKESGSVKYKVYYKIDNVLVNSDDIYDGNQNERKNWINSDTYNVLKDSFSCPSRMFIDRAGGLVDYNELCFENQGGNCTDFNRVSTSFVPAYNSYDFSNEYSSVMTEAYRGLRDKFSDDNEEINKEKVKFLSTLDSGFKYDESESAKQNAANNCIYLGEKANEKYQNYLKTFSQYSDFYLKNYVDSILQSSANSLNSRNTYFYKYENLEKLDQLKKVNILDDIASSDNVSTISDLFSITYNKNVKESINFISSFCKDEANYEIDMRVDTDGDGVIDSDHMNDIIKSERVSFDIRLFSDPTIEGLNNPDSLTYSCSFLTDIADIISTAYFILEMVGLAILVVFTSMDYVKIFLNDNADELKKANSNFLKRLIIAVLLFLLPALVNFALRLFKIEGVNSEHPLCVQISNK